MPPASAFTSPVEKALFSSISRLMRTDTSELQKFPAQWARALARTTAKLESTTAFTLLFRVAPIEERNYGFTKRAIESMRSSMHWITQLRPERKAMKRSGVTYLAALLGCAIFVGFEFSQKAPVSKASPPLRLIQEIPLPG